MSKSSKVASCVLKALGDAYCLFKTLIYHRVYSCYVTGLLIERTAYKDTYYVRDFILPLFWPINGLNLNNSERIRNLTGQASDFFTGGADDVCRQIMLSIKEQDLRALRATPYGSEEFCTEFALVGPLDEAPMNRTFNVGAALAMAGQFAEARAHFEAIRSIILRNRKEAFVYDGMDQDFRLVSDCVDALSLGGVHLQLHLLACCRATAARLGLESNLQSQKAGHGGTLDAPG